ncbi:class I SAM-dependent methyltransferase [Salinispirillum sp. LH 10-3-1]|uniref:Ribosomal RNA small subunit methyltransferase J n=1 Tax=Salinispirillum sp. LH 10-3-1 TaxID=2952525 RepID=A0AB38YJ83_9GAMM
MAVKVALHPVAQAYADSHAIDLPDDLPLRSQPHAEDHFQLVVADGLALQPLQLGKVNPLKVDFVAGALAHRRLYGGGVQQDVAKACGLHQLRELHILDTTAGLGRDAFVLAFLGAAVTMVERHPVVHALLQDGIYRATHSEDADLQRILSRMQLQFGSAPELYRTKPLVAQVVYIDPMFPPRTKAAKVKVDMQSFHALVGADDDGSALLAWALASGASRVVVKRPRLAPCLLDQEPSHQLSGKANRFDVYALRKLTAQSTAV